MKKRKVEHRIIYNESPSSFEGGGWYIRVQYKDDPMTYQVYGPHGDRREALKSMVIMMGGV